jgi:hypothetical protein
LCPVSILVGTSFGSPGRSSYIYNINNNKHKHEMKNNRGEGFIKIYPPPSIWERLPPTHLLPIHWSRQLFQMYPSAVRFWHCGAPFGTPPSGTPLWGPPRLSHFLHFDLVGPPSTLPLSAWPGVQNGSLNSPSLGPICQYLAFLGHKAPVGRAREERHGYIYGGSHPFLDLGIPLSTP